MKKIVILLAVFLLDFILVQSFASAETGIIDSGFISFLLLCFTIAMAILLFYGASIENAHESWKQFYAKNRQNNTASQTVGKAQSLFRKKTPPSLELQYQFIDLVKSIISDMRESERTDGEIIAYLKEQKWDPQVIFIALSRVKKQAK